jgi:hypothetical protein
LGKSE